MRGHIGFKIPRVFSGPNDAAANVTALYVDIIVPGHPPATQQKTALVTSLYADVLTHSETVSTEAVVSQLVVDVLVC